MGYLSFMPYSKLWHFTFVTSSMKDFKELLVWQKSHLLALADYKTTKSFPKDELYSLTSQIRRSAISLPSNISEGCGRLSDRELAQFLVIASGSASELA